MNLNLVWNWRRVLKKSWSVRLALLSALLSAVEFAMPFIAPAQSSRRFAALALSVSIAAGVARIIAQKDIHDGER